MELDIARSSPNGRVQFTAQSQSSTSFRRMGLHIARNYFSLSIEGRTGELRFFSSVSEELAWLQNRMNRKNVTFRISESNPLNPSNNAPKAALYRLSHMGAMRESPCWASK